MRPHFRWLRVAALVPLFALFALRTPSFGLTGGTPLDLNRDGRGDVISAAPLEDIPGVANAGMVSILFGGAQGPGSTGRLNWQVGVPPIGGTPQDGEQFGFSVAFGDFDRNGWLDGAIGAPGKTLNGEMQAGQVYVVMNQGGVWGLAEPWHLGAHGLGGEPEFRDRFGAALVAADFDQDGFTDLGIGAPGRSFFFGPGGSFRNAAGAVQILEGSPTGLRAGPLFHQTPEPIATAGFGETLDWLAGRTVPGTPGHPGFDRHSWLAVGEPNRPVNGQTGAGAITLLPAYAGTGVTTIGAWTLHQDSPGVKDKAEKNDLFGTGILGACDGPFGILTVIVTAPYDDRGTAPGGIEAGLVHVLTIGPEDQLLEDRVIRLSAADQAAIIFGGCIAKICDEAIQHLFIGAPLFDTQRKKSGALMTFSGPIAGSQPFQKKQTTSLDSPGVPSVGQNGSAFGLSCATYAELPSKFQLLVGAPGQTVGTAQGAGELFSLPVGSNGMLMVNSTKRIRQQGWGGPETGDNFGWTIRGSGN